MRTSGETIPILIVGAGPVGLALAGDLGWRGQNCLIVEQCDGSIYQPRMDFVGPRTMEFCRRWGVADRVRAAGLVVVLHEEAREPLAATVLPDAGEVLVVVGPEGGISADEPDRARR